MLDFMESFDERQIRYAGTELRRLIDITARQAQRASQVSLPSSHIFAKPEQLMTCIAFDSYPSHKIGHTTRGQVGLDLNIITYHLCHFMPRSTGLHSSATHT